MGGKATKPEALYAWDEKADRLAVGSFGSVYKGAPKRPRSYEHVHVAPSAVAIKVVGTRRVGASERSKFHREFEILRTLKHAHIVQFLEIFEEKSRLTLVFELMEGGRLDERLRDIGGCLCEAEALATIKTLCLALDYLHRDMHIVHRDLKPENLLYASRARTDADLRLCDFGFARHLPTTSEAASTGGGGGGGGGGDGGLRMRTVCGSPEYVAPEHLACISPHLRVSPCISSAGVRLARVCGARGPQGERLLWHGLRHVVGWRAAALDAQRMLHWCSNPGLASSPAAATDLVFESLCCGQGACPFVDDGDKPRLYRSILQV